MAKLFANSGDLDQRPHFALFANYPFKMIYFSGKKIRVDISCESTAKQ